MNNNIDIKKIYTNDHNILYNFSKINVNKYLNIINKLIFNQYNEKLSSSKLFLLFSCKLSLSKIKDDFFLFREVTKCKTKYNNAMIARPII